MQNKISIAALDRVRAPGGDLKKQMRACVLCALGECFPYKACEVQLLYTDDCGIRKINHEQRGIDAPTDVLSFPAFDLANGETPVPEPGSGRIYLGDIVVSLERAEKQAEEFGHGLSRELGYLVVHGVLHLLGYDHETEAEARKMRSAEESVLSLLELTR